MPDRFWNWLSSISTIVVVALFGFGVWLRDRSNKHEVVLFGPDGSNGHKSRIGKLEDQVKLLLEWKIKEDTIDEIEEELRRDAGRKPERLRDKLHEDHH